jgi:Tfp pilus assembly protein PilF
VKKVDLAIDLLKLNLHAFPDHLDSYLYLARLFQSKGDYTQAECHLRNALAIEPGNCDALELLEKVQSG